MAANDRSSPAYDGGLTYDLLPTYCRWIISPWLVNFYPRLLHCNVEIRTAFLDRAIKKCATQVRQLTIPGDKPQRVRLVTFGGGYDVRSMKLMEQGIIDEAVELDLPIVIQAKRRCLESNRFRNRRPNIAVPTLYEVDLNQLDQVRAILQKVIKRDDNVITIFLFEGVLMYLNDGVSHQLRSLCNHVLQENHNMHGYLCMADRLDTVTDNDVEVVRSVLVASNWQLVDFLAKPGAARHMASARLSVGLQAKRAASW
jgi:O-methyltransferase involved in polyketide biosynthesis